MTLAKDINNRLDEMLNLRAEINKVKDEVPDDAVLNNHKTGKKTSKEGAIRVAEAMITQIKSDLNEITNNGLNVNEIFTNKFYVNDMMQDREIARQINEEKNKPSNPAPTCNTTNIFNEVDGSDFLNN